MAVPQDFAAPPLPFPCRDYRRENSVLSICYQAGSKGGTRSGKICPPLFRLSRQETRRSVLAFHEFRSDRRELAPPTRRAAKFKRSHPLTPVQWTGPGPLPILAGD